MSHRLETLGIVSLLAGEIFIIHPNIELHRYNMLALIIVWLISAIVIGYLGDKVYNKTLPSLVKPIERYILLICISVIIFVVFYGFGELVF